MKNILVCKTNHELVLCDFGNARILGVEGYKRAESKIYYNLANKPPEMQLHEDSQTWD